MMKSMLNKVQVDHDVDVALRSLQRGIVIRMFLTNYLCLFQSRIFRFQSQLFLFVHVLLYMYTLCVK